MAEEFRDIDWSGAPPSPQISRTHSLVEVLVFLFLIVPSMVLSFFVVKVGTLTFPFVAASTIVRDLSLVSLVFFFLWRNRESLHRLGLNFKNGSRDVLLGVALFFPIFFGAQVLEGSLHKVGFTAPKTPEPGFLALQGSGEVALAVFLVVVALAEEIIFRGYFMLRFQEVNLGPLGAAILSAVVFSLGHGYEGSAGVITVGVLGFVLALIYLWRGSLVAPIVIHFLQDFTGIVLPTLLGLK